MGGSPGRVAQQNALSSSHMRSMITAILRARATLARFNPRDLAIYMVQAFRAEFRMQRVNKALAASWSSVRTMASLHLLMWTL